MPIALLARAPCATRRVKELDEYISEAQAKHTAPTPVVDAPATHTPAFVVEYTTAASHQSQR